MSGLHLNPSGQSAVVAQGVTPGQPSLVVLEGLRHSPWTQNCPRGQSAWVWHWPPKQGRYSQICLTGLQILVGLALPVPLAAHALAALAHQAAGAVGAALALGGAGVGAPVVPPGGRPLASGDGEGEQAEGEGHGAGAGHQ